MTALRALVAAEIAEPVDPRVTAFAEALAGRYPEAAEAVVFYGSCLWSGRLDGLMLDFYLIVDDYRRTYDRRWLRVANRLLPPNVFFVEHQGMRAKYAVLSRADFRRLCSAETFNVSVWARFAQPSALVWARNDAARAAVTDAVAGAAPALLGASRPALGDRLSIRDLWTSAFAATYGAELRAEKATRGASLFDTAPERYRAFTAPVLTAAKLDASIDGDVVTFLTPARGTGRWPLRRAQGKLLSVARLIKAAFTFDGGIDYLAWKIERHSGVSVPLTAWQRRHPLLASLSLVPRLLWKKAIV